VQLLPGSVTLGALGVDFKDSIQPLILEVSWFTAGMERKSEMVLNVPIGELFQPLSMNDEDFISEQGIYIYIKQKFVGVFAQFQNRNYQAVIFTYLKLI